MGERSSGRKIVADKDPRHSDRGSIGLWLAIGTGIGVAIGAGMGVATRNMRVWLGVGIGVGMAIGLAIGLASQRSEP